MVVTKSLRTNDVGRGSIWVTFSRALMGASKERKPMPVLMPVAGDTNEICWEDTDEEMDEGEDTVAKNPQPDAVDVVSAEAVESKASGEKPAEDNVPED